MRDISTHEFSWPTSPTNVIGDFYWRSSFHTVLSLPLSSSFTTFTRPKYWSLLQSSPYNNRHRTFTIQKNRYGVILVPTNVNEFRFNLCWHYCDSIKRLCNYLYNSVSCPSVGLTICSPLGFLCTFSWKETEQLPVCAFFLYII